MTNREFFDLSIEWHRKMWNWLADQAEETNVLYHKSQFFKNFAEEIENIFEQPYDMFEANCFACNYDNRSMTGTCDCCPFIWPSSNCYEFCCITKADEDDHEIMGLFELWKTAIKKQNKTLYINTARVIANLPIREDARPNE